MNTLRLESVGTPWGWYKMLYYAPHFWVKEILVHPGESLSLQVHKDRNEFWTAVSPGLRANINGTAVDLRVGFRYDVMKGQIHRVWNPGSYSAVFIEIATGAPREDDITRLQDKYGR